MQESEGGTLEGNMMEEDDERENDIASYFTLRVRVNNYIMIHWLPYTCARPGAKGPNQAPKLTLPTYTEVDTESPGQR